MIIDYNKNIKVANPRLHLNGGNTKPKSTLGQSNPKHQQVHFHENDHTPDYSSTEASTQTMVHKCLSDCGMDPSDISISCKLSRPRMETHLKNHQEKSTPIKDMFLLEQNQSTKYLADRGANGGLADADMRVIQNLDREITIVGIDDQELTGLDVVTAAALFVGIFHEYAHLGKGRSVHAARQMEWFNCKVDDRSKVVHKE